MGSFQSVMLMEIYAYLVYLPNRREQQGHGTQEISRHADSVTHLNIWPHLLLSVSLLSDARPLPILLLLLFFNVCLSRLCVFPPLLTALCHIVLNIVIVMGNPVAGTDGSSDQMHSSSDGPSASFGQTAAVHLALSLISPKNVKNFAVYFFFFNSFSIVLALMVLSPDPRH